MHVGYFHISYLASRAHVSVIKMHTVLYTIKLNSCIFIYFFGAFAIVIVSYVFVMLFD